MNDGAHTRDRCDRAGRRLSVAALLAAGLTILLLALAPAAGAGPRAIIWDWLATPSWTSMTDPITGVGDSYDEAYDVTMTKGNVIFVAGERGNVAGNLDVTLTKYKSGVKLWTVDYNGPGNGDDTCGQMALSPDGKSVYIVGTAGNTAGNADLVVLKRSAKTGALKWARRYDGPNHLNDTGDQIAVDPYGNVIAAGFSLNATDPDWTVTSWTASGAKRWTWHYKGSGTSTDIVMGLVSCADGSVIAGGFSTSPTGLVAVTARLSGSGTKMWLKKYLGPSGLGAQITNLTPGPKGGVYACGTLLTSTTGADGMVLRYSLTGKRKDFAYDAGAGGTFTQFFNDVAVTSTKDVVAVGYENNATDADCRVTVYHPDGSISVAATLAGAWSDWFNAVATDKLGGYYVTGTHHVAAGDCKILTVRGSVLAGGGGWFSQFGPVVSLNNWGSAIAVRGTTACVVGEYDSGGATNVDQAVLTYVY